MSLKLILAYTLLPLLSLTGGLAVMFVSKAPIAMQPAFIGFGGVMLVIAFGGLSLTMAMQAVCAQSQLNRTER